MTTIHILPNASGITSERYRTDAFGIATCKFIKSMSKLGYNIIHYGHEAYEVDCEHHTLVNNNDFPAPEDAGVMLYHNNRLKDIFNKNLDDILPRTKSPGDLVACFYGYGPRPVLDKHPDLVITEPSIGYPAEAVFAPYRGFVSYAWMHYYYGTQKQLMEPSWYDEVIPNAFDPEEFTYNENKQEYFIFIGRMITSKGIDLAIQVTKHLGVKLIIASSGKLQEIGYDKVPDHVIEAGYVNAEQRRNLLAHARCLIAPTYYIEPFGNIVVEAGLSGTPVLTTDWGGFSENVAHGATGYRCKDFNSFIKGAQNILEGKIKSSNCRRYTESNYNLEIVHKRIDSWYKRILRNDFYHLDQ